MNKNNLSFILALGIVGGVGFILCDRFYTGAGPKMFLIYGMFLALVGITLYRENIVSTRQRFLVALGAYMFAGLCHYFFRIIVFKIVTLISPFGHLWRIGALLVFGAPFVWVVARLSGRANSTMTDKNA